MEPSSPLSTADVRAIVHDELNALALSLQQGDSFGDMIAAVLDRMDAAGRAMDLHEARPGHVATAANTGEVAGPPAAYGDFTQAHPATADTGTPPA